MSILKGRVCYLSGPIENGGDNWRPPVTDVLVNTFGINLFDPFEDPKQQWFEPLMKAKAAKNYDEIARIARNFVRKDLCMVDRSDFLIAYLPYKVATCGTHHEIINSVNSKKPTLLVCEQGKENLPLWYYGFISHECMFDSWEKLYDYLYCVETGLYRGIHDKWDYIYGLI